MHVIVHTEDCVRACVCVCVCMCVWAHVLFSFYGRKFLTYRTLLTSIPEFHFVLPCKNTHRNLGDNESIFEKHNNFSLRTKYVFEKNNLIPISRLSSKKDHIY